MDDSKVLLQPGFILQHRKYGETSLIFDVLTKDFGIVSILAKGVRKKKSKTAGLLLAFTALKLSYIGKKDLKTLTHVEIDSPIVSLSGLALYCSFYVNELIGFLLHKYDPHPEVFFEYKKCLALLYDAKETEQVEQVLRFFELNFMEQIGYAVPLIVDSREEGIVKPEQKYYYSEGFGMVENVDGYITGKTLLALESRESLNRQALNEAKSLMRKAIDSQLHGKVLKSRAVLAKIIKQL